MDSALPIDLQRPTTAQETAVVTFIKAVSGHFLISMAHVAV